MTGGDIYNSGGDPLPKKLSLDNIGMRTLKEESPARVLAEPLKRQRERSGEGRFEITGLAGKAPLERKDAFCIMQVH
jgi:hypothetical protein